MIIFCRHFSDSHGTAADEILHEQVAQGDVHALLSWAMPGSDGFRRGGISEQFHCHVSHQFEFLKAA